MRGLFVTNPGLGHLRPMVPIARAFKDAGHEVAFACAPDFRPCVENLGFMTFSAGFNWLEYEAEKAFPQIRRLPLNEMELWFLTEVFAGVIAQRMCPSLLELCEVWKPDLLISNDFEFSTHVVAERTGIPFATIGLGIYLPGRAMSSVIGRHLAELRTSNGLPSDPELSKLHGDLYISWLPRTYHFPDTSFPEGFQSLHAPNTHELTDELKEEGPPDWIRELPDQPTVLATLGTVFNKTPEATEIFQAIIDGLRNEPVNLVMTVGPGQDPDAFGQPPAQGRIVRYVPHSALLPHCDLAITQGGSSTTRAALGRGLPVLLIPLNGEDVFHAMRCNTLGVGYVVKQKGMFDNYLDARSFKDLSPDAIRLGVRTLLQSPEYRRNAQRLALEMKSLPGPEHAVTMLEQLARGKAVTAN